MTKANKVLFITQEITPYVSESEMSLVGRNLPQAIQEKGREIRTFMPKWGNINERRNQLHEVIRLSGMNLIIDDTDFDAGASHIDADENHFPYSPSFTNPCRQITH